MSTSDTRSIVAPLLLSLIAACQAVPADEPVLEPVGERLGHRNALTFAAGEFNEASERGARFAIDYERRFPEGWGIVDSRVGMGVIVEGASNPVETLLLAGQIVIHPVEPVSLILASGFSDNDDPDTGSDSWLVRLGMRYSFQVAESVSFGPEVFYDLLEEGRRKSVFGFALSFGF